LAGGGVSLRDSLSWIFHVGVVEHPHSVYVTPMRSTANHLGMARAIVGGGVSLRDSNIPAHHIARLKEFPFGLGKSVDMSQSP
jgi:hypothetical protein